jgi:hypothetical protein
MTAAAAAAANNSSYNTQFCSDENRKERTKCQGLFFKFYLGNRTAI